MLLRSDVDCAVKDAKIVNGSAYENAPGPRVFSGRVHVGRSRIHLHMHNDITPYIFVKRLGGSGPWQRCLSLT